ncbi:hypothetical protein Pmar_PMAR005294 [Perkinsus marinus ATCC 50983]|uniref:Uncharacterized protein n=1 Tax=Perkinsus marinus (strain ATCC 50983 / TXsc) TaxID=423536 RepID=C5KB57_PERM5|nr:hypothetical protein Pmar_PMAR005294 [Perkinsus marinus ATCC 50983]EER18383.1 hypothetical protein Pmar_PMAR005294 [Perkinsus marinus ATCC 50983]|eukprot:XP_002786587.1 hypothetical protein Pmar_PMAR005294 [Perkinsus marinus ATCC 50983]
MADHDAAILPDLPPDASLTSLPALLSESANPGLVTAGAGRRSTFMAHQLMRPRVKLIRLEQQQQQQRGQTESNQWRERQHHHVKRDDGISGSSLLETPSMGLQDNYRQYSKTSRGPWVGKGGGTPAHLGNVQQQQGPPAMVAMSAEGTGGEGWPTGEDSDGRDRSHVTFMHTTILLTLDAHPLTL